MVLILSHIKAIYAAVGNGYTMKKSKVVFLNSNYKLLLEVSDRVNQYRQHCYTALIKLQTVDGFPIIEEGFSFQVLHEKFVHVDLAFEFYFSKLQSGVDLKMVAYNLYLLALRENNQTAKKL